jgi:hypothetical protein
MKSDQISNLDLDDLQSFKCIVKWLENRKIRYYPPEDRVQLDNIQEAKWNDAFSTYVSDLGGNSNVKIETLEERTRVLDWLLSYAIGMEYSDRAEDLQKVRSQEKDAEQHSGSAIEISSEQEIELDLDSPEFKNNLNALAESLGIPKDDSIEAMLRACATVLEQKFTDRALASTDKV